jgi:WD40 repeat protein
MPNRKLLFLYFLIPFLIFCDPLETLAILPMQGYHDLVAGQGAPGLKDGIFYDAFFHTPKGLALSPDGKHLYVADQDNNCIRMINLDNGNQVSTLVGTGTPGYTDGIFNLATFNKPNVLVFLPNQQIVVWDSGNARIRLIDLNQKTVSTLAGDGTVGTKDGFGNQAQVGGIWNMAYLSSQNALYFTQPGLGALRKIDLKTQKVSNIFIASAGQPLPQPGALCATEDKLYIADLQQAQVYELTPKNPAPVIEKDPLNERDAYDWNLVSSDSRILALTWSDGFLYGLKNDLTNPVARLWPNPRPVAFISPWSADPSQSPNPNPFLADVQRADNISLIADTRSAHKFYMANPSLNIVTSFRDLSFEDPNQSGLMDFEYPFKKPLNTYRILIVGSSLLFHNYHFGHDTENRMELTAKRLEFMLNTEAALDDVPLHFEILTLAKTGAERLNLWPYYEVPPMVKKYDVDLVLIELMKSVDMQVNLSLYYLNPLNKDGIPGDLDPAFSLKRWPDKSQHNIAEEFLELCLNKNLATIDENGNPKFSDFDLLLQKPEVRSDMVKMYSRPLKLLNEQLVSTKTGENSAVRMEIFLMPSPASEFEYEFQSSFWQSILDEIGAPSVNLSTTLRALRISFFPFYEQGGYHHFDANGHLLAGYLFAHYLIQNKIIPWK